MKEDAIQKNVSDAALKEAGQQNAEVLAAELNSGESKKTDKPVKTPIDPPEEKPREVAQRVLPRDKKLADMADKRSESVLDPSNSLETAKASAAGLPPEQQPGAVKRDASGQLVKIKVDGKETDVEAEKVFDAGIRTLQKEASADQRLELAGKKMSELTAKEQQLAKREQELQERENGVSAKKPPPTGDVSNEEMSDDDAKALVEDLYSGNKEKAAKAVKKLAGRKIAIQGEAPQQYTPDQLVTMMEEKVAAKATLTTFYTRFPDIRTDEILKNAVNAESIRLAKEHKDWSKEKLLIEAGSAVTKKYGGREVIDDTGFREKADRKSKTDTVTGADVARRPQQQEPPPSRKAVIANMKADRRA